MKTLAFLILCIENMIPNEGVSVLSEVTPEYFMTQDGLRLYYSKYLPDTIQGIVIYITGITGLDSEEQIEFIDTLRAHNFGSYFLHPRGTGYSGGRRGDENIERFLSDYQAFAENLRKRYPTLPFFLFGHSMSGAFAIDIAVLNPKSYSGVIVINPAYKYKQSKGAGPGLGDYVKYAFYYLFAPAALVVDMTGDSALVEHPEDAKETASRMNDSLVVKKFSMRYMAASKGIMNRCVGNAKKLDLPLLLIHGEKDEIIDQSGHYEIFKNWRSKDKTMIEVKDGGHGYHVVLWSLDKIAAWLLEHKSLNLSPL